MALTQANIQTIIDTLETHALASGWFESVNTHEPKKKPDGGLTAAVWLDGITPATGESGLAATSLRLVFNVRIYTSMLAEPQDAIDPQMSAAAAALMEDYTGDFSLGGNVKNIDVLGMGGLPLQAQAGYINQDGQLFRVVTISVPVVVADAWTQTA